MGRSVVIRERMPQDLNLEIDRLSRAEAANSAALRIRGVALTFPRVAHWIGMPARYVAKVSRYWTRGGSPQDVAALDI